jgi:quinol monooxygenase YgiN
MNSEYTLSMNRLLEIRTYRLKPGTFAAFHDAMHNRAVPMLKSKGMDVVAYGRSNHEEETYFLVRSYPSREALEAEQAQFYGSPEWRRGPRPELLERIESYVNTLLWVSPLAVESIRAENQATPP